MPSLRGSIGAFATLLREVLAESSQTIGICPLPLSDWSTLRVYALSPHPIGPPCGYMPSPLV
eukprot:981844-Prorocentrum_minimum.AAC.2